MKCELIFSLKLIRRVAWSSPSLYDFLLSRSRSLGFDIGMETQSPQASAASVALFYSKSMVRGRLFLHLKDVHASTRSFCWLSPFSLKAGTLSSCNTRAFFVNVTSASSGLRTLFGMFLFSLEMLAFVPF